MIEHSSRLRVAVATVVRVLVVFDTVTFLAASLLHLGARIPLGFTVLEEPRIVPAAIVEGLAGLALAVSAYAIFTSMTWARPVALVAQAFALSGVLLGIWALAMGGGPRTELNDLYHRLILLALLAGLALLATPIAKAALARNNQATQQK